MKTKTITLYSLSELSKEAQERAHKEWVSHNDYIFLSDCLNERLHEDLLENGITDLNDTSKPGTKPTKVQYSLFSSPGDGCMFAGDFKWKTYTVHIKQRGLYTHSYSKEIDIWDENENSLYNEASGKVEKLYGEFETIYQKICKNLERYGYDWIEEENSFENFKESCDANEYTFLESGIMEN